jgi:hypothetical protein
MVFLPTETIEKIFEHLCELVIFSQDHNHNITSNKHSKRIIDKSRLINKYFKNHIESYFFKIFKDTDLFISKNCSDLSSEYLKKFKEKNYKMIHDNFVDILIKDEINFWECIILNIPPTTAKFLISIGFFKFINICTNIEYSKKCFCFHDNKIMLKRSKDKNYWYFNCYNCKFYEVIVNYKNNEKHKRIFENNINTKHIKYV